MDSEVRIATDQLLHALHAKRKAWDTIKNLLAHLEFDPDGDTLFLITIGE